MPAHPKVLVVGAGIVGASIAWHLARVGAEVTIVEQGDPGGLATRGSWAWINATWGNPETYVRLRLLSMQEWRRLEREVPAVRVRWNGGLTWDVPTGALESFVGEHRAWGYAIRVVDRDEAKAIEPQLATPPDRAAYAPGEGSVEPLATARTLLAAAQQLGATLLTGTPVRAIEVRGRRVVAVAIDGASLRPDEVVVAAGVGSCPLAATADVNLPVTASPGLVVASKPHARLLNGLAIAPEVGLRQTEEGRIVAVSTPDGVASGADGTAAAIELFDTVKSMLLSGASLVLERHIVADRPIPVDGFPVVGRPSAIDGLYLAVMHSGVTLAPAIGRFVAEEITTGQRAKLLDPYGPDRFRR